MKKPLLIAGLLVASCGGHQHAGEDLAGFDCRGRSAEYIVVGSMAGEELGIALDCKDAGPRVRRWRVGHDGTRDDQAKSMTPHEFDDTWARIQDTGWGNLHDCGKAKSGDPVYTFDVKNSENANSFSCSGRGDLPFPYSALVNELDQAAASITGHDRENPGLGQ
jgi:hypothetical protein